MISRYNGNFLIMEITRAHVSFLKHLPYLLYLQDLLIISVLQMANGMTNGK